MNGKILGIPTVFIFFVVGIALLIDVPMVLLHTAVQKHLTTIDQSVETNTLLEKRNFMVLTATPTATLTPKVTPTPTPVVFKRVVTSIPKVPAK